MASDALIAAGVGLLVGGGILLVARGMKQAAPDDDKPKTSPCDALAKLGVPKEMCEKGLELLPTVLKIGEKVADAVFTTSADVAKWDAENKTLNGEIATELHPFVVNSMSRTYPTGPGRSSPALQGTVAEFKTGCVPFKDSNGWTKCAPGTHDMTVRINNAKPQGYPTATAAEPLKNRTSETAAWANVMVGSRKQGGTGAIDITTGGPWLPGTPNFPIAIPAGHLGWMYRGTPFVCKDDADPQWDVRDHRDGVTRPVCAGAFVTSDEDRFSGAPVTECGGPNQPACACYWRRVRAGETSSVEKPGYVWVCPDAGVADNVWLTGSSVSL